MTGAGTVVSQVRQSQLLLGCLPDSLRRSQAGLHLRAGCVTGFDDDGAFADPSSHNRTGSSATWRPGRRAGTLVLLDVGGYFAPALADACTRYSGKILGVVEDTENGLRRIRKDRVQRRSPVARQTPAGHRA